MNQKTDTIIGFKISDGSPVTESDLKADPSLKNQIIEAERARACSYDMKMLTTRKNVF